MKLLAFNLKMNLLYDEIGNYITEIKKNNLENTVFFPSSIYINDFNKNNIPVGAQDISFSHNGAYTGDVSIEQLKSIGIKYSIVGHSERRNYYMEDRFVNKKIKLCLENDVIPILCVGETQNENSKEESYRICIDEIDKAFMGNENLDKVIISYEPIWSIGSGQIPTNDFIEEIVSNIKKYVYNKYGVVVRVLYGGSVNDENLKKLSSIKCVDGFLIGGSSLDTESIKRMIEINRGV